MLKKKKLAITIALIVLIIGIFVFKILIPIIAALPSYWFNLSTIKNTFNFAVFPQYDHASDFNEGLASVKIGNKYGYIDKNGNMVIKPQFDFADSFYNGIALIRINTNGSYKSGYIDKTGKIIIKVQFDDGNEFSENLAVVKVSNKYGYIDKTGKFVIPPRYNFADNFSEGLAHVTIFKENSKNKVNDLKDMFIDKTGKIILIAKNENFMSSFHEGFASAIFFEKKSTFWGYINKKGRRIVLDVDTFPNNIFSEGLVTVYYCKKKAWGVVNGSGKFVIKPQKNKIGTFHEGLALYCIRRSNERWPCGYINRNGKIVIKPKYYYGSDFKKNYASVEEIDFGRMGLINKKGEFIILPIFDNISSLHEDKIRVVLGHKYGFIKN